MLNQRHNMFEGDWSISVADAIAPRGVIRGMLGENAKTPTSKYSAFPQTELAYNSTETVTGKCRVFLYINELTKPTSSVFLKQAGDTDVYGWDNHSDRAVDKNKNE